MDTLPDELIYTILSYATGFEKYHEKDAIVAYYQRRSRESYVFEIPCERHRIVRVCKRWYTIGLEFLYSSVILRDPIGLLSLKCSFLRSPRLAALVQAFSIFSENTRLYSDPDLRTVLDACSHLLVFSSARMTVLPIAQRKRVLYMSIRETSSIRDTFDQHARVEDASQLNLFTELQTLHLTRESRSLHWRRTLRDRISLPHLNTLILEFDDPHSQSYESICKWSLPSLAVLQIRNVMSYSLCAIMYNFQSTLVIVDATVFTNHAVYAWTLSRLTMPYLRHFSVSGGLVDFGSLFGSVNALETLEFGLDWVHGPGDHKGWAIIRTFWRIFVLDWVTRAREEGGLLALREARFRIEYPDESTTILLAEIGGVFRQCLQDRGIEVLDGPPR